MTYTVVQTKRGPIEYFMEGDGPAVLVLQGGHSSRTTRLSHEKLATAGFTVIIPSRPGYDSTPVEVGRTAQEAADALIELLDALKVARVAVIGISAAGPTAIALAKRHPAKVQSLILESAVTLPWDPKLKSRARFMFGRSERITWALLRFALRAAPFSTTKMMLSELTTLDINDVVGRMDRADLQFVQQMLRTMRSGDGFMADIEHRVDRLDTIQAPVLVMYSPNDKSVPPSHARRVAEEARQVELFEVPADTHFIWIGPTADQVWAKRLEFLRSTVSSEARR